MIHHKLSYIAAWNLTLLLIKDLCLHLIDQRIHLIDRHCALMAGTEHTALDLRSVITLPALILLDHNKRDCLHLLIGSETLSTFITLSSAPDRCIIICRA